MNTVTERPILFNGEMVRAIFDGRKTQTRRPVKPILNKDGNYMHAGNVDLAHKEILEWRLQDGRWFGLYEYTTAAYADCPYGQVGNRLWVRETFMGWYNTDDNSFSHVAAFKADGYELELGEKWSPSIHMPRAASRITLEITNIRIERLHRISESDSMQEGSERLITKNCTAHDRVFLNLPLMDDLHPYKNGFALQWDCMYGNWQLNPWVWVIEFKRVL